MRSLFQRTLIIVSIAVLALLFISLYWFLFKPLPKTSGTLKAPVASGAVVTRDKLGVPHIEAATISDVLFLQGFVTAGDRLWQMDNLRRFAAGELSEVYGRQALEQDQLSRAMRMRHIAEHYVQTATEEERRAFEDYARGVNYFINSHRGNYEWEFSVPHRRAPRAWTATDCMLVFLIMFRDLTTSWQTDLARQNLFTHATDRSKAEQLFPPSEGDYLSPGSNSWAVSGQHSASGKAMLASDPHLGYSIPSIWYMVHLKCAGLNVIGVALPGVPGVIIGHNENIAWGMTNIGADYQDLYREDIDLATGRYRFQGATEQSQLEQQQIQIYGEKPMKVKTWITRHGPIIPTKDGNTYALRWTAADGAGFPGLSLDRARNWQEFRSALKRFWGPPQNLVYADRAGNIGYQATGAMPIRRGFRGFVPLDGASGAQEWSGYVPYDQLPSYFNPPDGMVATANQNPFPADFPYAVEGNFSDGYRVKQIRNRLQAMNKPTIDDFLAIQKDVFSEYHFFLAQTAVAALKNGTAPSDIPQQTASMLAAWNGQMDKDQAVSLITELLNREIARWLLQRVAPNTTVTLTVRPQRIEQMLKEQPAGWVKDNDWAAWLKERLANAIKSGQQSYGDNIAKWTYGSALQWFFAHPIGSHLPLVNGLFDIGPTAMSGAGTTVKQTTSKLGPSMRMVIDWAAIDRSEQNIAVGESEQITSGHYQDQWPAYYEGRSFPMQFNHVEAESVLRVQPE